MTAWASKRAAGPLRITVMLDSTKTLLLTLVLSLAIPVCAQDLSGFERLLFPVVPWPNQIDGADGSSFSAINRLFAEEDTRVFPKYDRTDVEGQVIWTPKIDLVPAGMSDGSIFCCAPSRLGRVLFVERGAAVSPSETLIARASDGYSSISSLPIVRERDFRSGTIHIIDVVSLYTYTPAPVGTCRTATPQFRHRLRVYDLNGTGTGAVRVRTYENDLGPQNLPPISETTLTLDQREGSDASYPYFAELVIDEICHPFSCHTPCAGGSQRLEIEPLIEGMTFWAFVSGTDNANQRVVVNWPQ